MSFRKERKKHRTLSVLGLGDERYMKSLTDWSVSSAKGLQLVKMNESRGRLSFVWSEKLLVRHSPKMSPSYTRSDWRHDHVLRATNLRRASLMLARRKIPL